MSKSSSTTISRNRAWSGRVLGQARHNGHALGLLVLAVMVAVMFSALSPSIYATPLNVQSIAFAVPEIGLMALAISIAMTTAGIDLSTVAVANLAALTAAFVSLQGQEAGMSTLVVSVVAVAAALAVGMLCGVLNAAVIAVIGVAPILATLATQMLLAGLAVLLTEGRPIYGLTPELTAVGTGTFAAVPTVFWIFLLVIATAAFIMRRTGYGLRATMIGANAVASDYSGINRSGVIFRTYMLTGTISAVAGLVMVMRTVSAAPGYGSSYLLLAVTIAVLAGVNPFGGRVAVWGVALAAVVLQMISSGLNILGYSAYIYQIVQGLILVGVMILRVEGIRAVALVHRARSGGAADPVPPVIDRPYEEGHDAQSSSGAAYSSHTHQG
ncbi:ABC transporter permease [Actinotalea sp. K2]|uniref:ABC transporter permease n=1 Tax=Actinotalea sp. K2 TaxID=2939438 RepID=UPI0020172914|nr:ABC transporter permease [Actinotalea sp. K2]MCL3862082.1 ABC transporter permease [Actinotalea sp. K2]